MLNVFGRKMLSLIRFRNKCRQKPSPKSKKKIKEPPLIVNIFDRFLLRTKLKILSLDSFIGRSVQGFQM